MLQVSHLEYLCVLYNYLYLLCSKYPIQNTCMYCIISCIIILQVSHLEYLCVLYNEIYIIYKYIYIYTPSIPFGILVCVV